MWTFWKYYRLSNHSSLPKLKKTRNYVEQAIIIAGVFTSLYCLIFYSPFGSISNFHNQDPFTKTSIEVELPSPIDHFTCFNKDYNYQIRQRGQYYVLYNYVRAKRWFACHESITYTTIGDLTFLDNVKPLIEHWKGPVSVALYTPGTDFHLALSIIRYLRICESPLISEYVTFHLYFEIQHLPEEIPMPENVWKETVNCFISPWSNLNKNILYREEKKLKFPINVGRNIARDAATTHFVLASDIELYPSVNFIPEFLKFQQRIAAVLRNNRPKVFVLPPFEVAEGYLPPKTKQELVTMLRNKTAVEFHRKVCHSCHHVPRIEDWIKANITEGLHIFHTAKKSGMWEPFYVGTNAEPYFDERLTWEGRCNKLTQAYAMCILDYDYHILDNAFLIHKPGIKVFSDNPVRQKAFSEAIWLIRSKIKQEIHKLYGVNENCSTKIWYGRNCFETLTYNNEFQYAAVAHQDNSTIP